MRIDQLTEAARELVREWDKEEWSGNLKRKVTELAERMAKERDLRADTLLEEARRLDPRIGRHYIKW